MKTAVIYARYSSDKQTEQSIEGQLYVCNEYAKSHDITIVDTYIDRAMTGTNDNRIDFQKMLKDSNKKAWDYVLVYKLDRFSRNKYETAVHKKTLRDNGVKLLSAMENIPDTPEGILMESLLEGMAEYYSAELAQKVTRGMNESRKKGQFTGGKVIYGYYVKDKKLYINEHEAEIVRYIYNQYGNGVYVKDIIEDLTSKGILKDGKPFKKNYIYEMLKNEKYVGIYKHNNEVYTNIYPPILNNETYEIVRNKVDENKYGKHKADVVYLLKNKLICGYCGKSITSDSGTSSTGNIRRYYNCLGKKQGYNCHNKSIRKEILEDLIIETTMNQLNSKSNLELLADKIIQRNKKVIDEQIKLKQLEKDKKELEFSIQNIINAIEKGIFTNSTKQRLEELEKQLTVVDTNITIEKSKQNSNITIQDIYKYIKSALNKNKQILIKTLIEKIIIYNDKIEIYYNYTDNKNAPDVEQHQAFLFFNYKFVKMIEYNKLTNEIVKLEYDIQGFI